MLKARIFVFVGLSCLILGLALHPAPAAAPEPPKHYAWSLVGAPKYRPGFKHFDTVNPEAPKGGSVRLWAQGTFDSVNTIPLKGDKAVGLHLMYDQLMAMSLEEPLTDYGLIAEWASYPADYSSVTFKLRPEARWHDGQPVTPEDVIFSMEIQKKANPSLGYYYKNVMRGEKTGEHEVTFFFDCQNNRELPQIVGHLTVVPKHYWTGKGPDGAPRDPMKTTLDPPPGSGPYKIKEVIAGRHIVYERVAGYWAKDLPVRKGYFNFEQIKYFYFRDQMVAAEAFKAGLIDFYVESNAKNWATGYKIPAVERGFIIKRGDIQLKTPAVIQAFILNNRRGKFADIRVRKAFNFAFDFEWTNNNLFHRQYKRTNSFFQNTELAADGPPEGQELAILDEMRGSVPAEVFSDQYRNPANLIPGDFRRHLMRAAELLREAGWNVKDDILTHKSGERMTVEFLLLSPSQERIVLPYIRSLDRLGIRATVRVVDAPQYKQRIDTFDFDIVIGNFPQSESPGNEQRNFWGSEAAGKNGSRNLMGIKNPAVDKLIDRIIFAKDRKELVAAARALDRVLVWNHYLVLQWHVPFERIAYWNRFDHPQALPSRTIGFLQVWWQDKAKEAKLAGAPRSTAPKELMMELPGWY